MAGVALGVMALIVVLSVMNGFQEELRTRILGVASHMEITGSGGQLHNWPDLARQAAQHPEVRGMAPFVSGQALLVQGSETKGAMLRGLVPAEETKVAEFASHMKQGKLEDLRPGEFNILLGSDLARSLGLSDKTVRSYLDILSGSFMVRQLQPWYENLSKRQVKAPKVYLRDTGLLHALLTQPDLHTLYAYPRVGPSWEGFVIEQVIQVTRPAEAYFWATHSGAEVDLLMMQRGQRYGIEVKFSEAPQVTRSMHIALQDLALDHLWVIHPGPHTYPVHDKITVLSIKDLMQLKAPSV